MTCQIRGCNRIAICQIRGCNRIAIIKRWLNDGCFILLCDLHRQKSIKDILRMIY